MKLLARKKLRFALVGLIASPPLFWALVLLVVPTGWARTRLVAALERSTGQPVGLESVRLSAFGGVRLTGLTLGRAEGEAGPWLRVADLAIDVNVAQLLGGHIEPGKVEVSGVDLRV